MNIGIDLGGTNLVVGLVDKSGKLVDKISKKTRVKDGHIAIIDDMVESIINLKDKNKVNIESIGIGVPGLVDGKSGIVIECVNLNWKDIYLKDIIEERLNIKTFIGNDATVAALAEYVSGSLKDSSTSILVTLGTGIGGGFIIDEKIYLGKKGIASEIGHMVIGENFYDCNCGRNGCFETYCSASAVVKYAKKVIEENTKDDKDEFISKFSSEIEVTSKDVFDYAKNNNKYAILILDRFFKYMAKALVNLVVMIDPEIIAFGGGVSKAGEYMIKKIEEYYEKERIVKKVTPPKFVLAEMGNDAGIIGSAFLGEY